MVSTANPDPVIVLWSKLATNPVGADGVSVTVPLNPFCGATVMVEVWLEL
jgi:hypothetical protein